jgi:hypothetical protein
MSSNKERWVDQQLTAENMRFYGDREFFLQKKAHGFDKVAFGIGGWFDSILQEEKYRQLVDSGRMPYNDYGVERMRIVSLWVFLHPTKKVETLETIKIDVYGFTRRLPEKIVGSFPLYKDFEKFLVDFRIDLSDWTDLDGLNKNWEIIPLQPR